MKFDAYATRNLVKAGYDVWLTRKDGEVEQVGTCVGYYPLPTDSSISVNPTLCLPYEQAQVLMDALYQAGVRPSEAGGAGEREALRNHLQDMKRIAFGLLKNNGVEP